jgi:PAS domain S-box-containing protein
MAAKPLSQEALSPLLNGFVAKAKETVIITDTDLGSPDGPLIVHANAAVELTTGYRLDDLLGRRLGLLYQPETLPAIFKQMREALDSNVPVETEFPAHGKDGKLHWMEITTTAVHADDGRATHFVRVGRDITARKRAELERETTQRLLASVFGVIDQALGVVDDHGRFAMLNTAMSRQFGWSVFDLIGKPFTDVIDGAERQSVERQVATTEEMTFRMSARLRHRNGDVTPGELTVTSIPQPDGRQYRVIMLRVRDLTAIDKDFASAVRKALQGTSQTGTIVAGKLQLVGLAEVRVAIGDRWPALAERSFQVAENILRRHIGPTDVFSRTADDGFLVCFSELDETAAQFKARTIGNEIREKLVGEFPEMAATQVTSFATTIAIGNEDLVPADGIIGALEARLARERKRLEDNAVNAMRSTLTTARVVFQAVKTEANQTAPIALVRLPSALESALSTLVALGNFEYLQQTEMLVMTGAAERVLAELKDERTDLILPRVRLATLTHRRDADQWLQVARTLGAPGKKRLVIEIGEIDKNTARSRLTDVTMMVSSLFRAVAFELPTIDPAFIPHLPITAPLVTIEARLLGDNAATNVPRLLKALLPRRCRLIIKNVLTPALAMTLVKAGATLMTTSAPE